jgi:hypothetical protein
VFVNAGTARKTSEDVNPILSISLSFFPPLARGSISSPIPRGPQGTRQSYLGRI